MRYLFTFLLAVLVAFSSTAQNNHWQTFEEANILLPQRSEVNISAKQYQTLSLDFDALRANLAQAPMEFTPEAKTQAIQLYLPLPNGEMELMQVVESPVMAPELAAKFPSIKTFAARSVDNKMISARFDFSPFGFNATIVTPEGRAFIGPYATEQTRFYISYYSKDEQFDLSSLPPLSCGFDDFATEEELDYQQQETLSEQTNLSFRNVETVPLRTYRLALACTGEYGQNKGGTTEAVMATYNTALNLLNQIFLLEFSARFELIPGVEALIFLDPNTDPYVNSNNGGNLLGQNTAVVNTYFSPEQYDVGHVFTMGCTDVGGIAALASLCSSNKARGVTCHYTSLNNIVRQVMAHEVGHQFSCGHSFNNCPGSDDQLSSANAFEPGSGSTIMSYQGSCGPLNNLPFPSGDYYNIGSLEDLIFFSRQSTGASCGESIDTDNNQPEITLSYEDDFFIPISTPFELDVEAEDVDGDPLTYCWEQYDLGPNVNLGNPILNSPLFRSFPPANPSNRVFPAMAKVVNGNFDNTEVLPTYSRDLTFKVTVRDNNPDHGGVVWDDVAFKSDETAGPFRVTSPNTTDVTWKVGDSREVTWNVANTDNSRVKCNYVNIRLSTDGGFTYPYTLVEGTPNDGSAFVTVPDALSPQARVRVEAANNIFFDISNENFIIDEATEPGFTLDIFPVAIPLYCYPGDNITIDINSTALLGYDSALELSLDGDLPSYVTTTFAATSINPGDATTLTFEFDDFTGRDTFNLQVRATTPSEEIALRDLRIIILSNDFSELSMQAPANGETGIVFTTDFSWNDIPAANTYEIQIATSAGFEENSIVESESGIVNGEYIPEVIFEVNEIYFWRIRPINDCGPGAYLAPFAFQTSTVDCLTNVPQDLPIALPNNPSTKISTIFVPTNGTISDVNIDDLQITYQPLNSLEISLVSPALTEVIIFDQNCLNTGLLNISFDDEAPTDIICPPINGNPMRPDNPLSAFDQEDTQGEWQLKVRIVTPGFGGGSINTWNVEFCATVSNPAPSLIRNETLPVPPGQGNVITADFLEVQDEASAAAGIKYTLMSVPTNGQLYRATDPSPLQQGESFTQETINAFNLSYVHDGSATDTDQFQFIVENEAGGWIPNQIFNIEIDENATVNTNDTSFDNELQIFPNPAKDKVAVSFAKPMTGNVSIRILNLQGQEINHYNYNGIDTQVQFSTALLASGIYFIAVEGDAGKITRKLAVQR